MEEQRKKLFEALTQRKLYTKSEDEFNQMLDDDERRSKLFEALSERKLYTNTQEDFDSKYGAQNTTSEEEPEVEETPQEKTPVVTEEETSNMQVPQEIPEEAVEQEETPVVTEQDAEEVVPEKSKEKGGLGDEGTVTGNGDVDSFSYKRNSEGGFDIEVFGKDGDLIDEMQVASQSEAQAIFDGGYAPADTRPLREKKVEEELTQAQGQAEGALPEPEAKLGKEETAFTNALDPDAAANEEMSWYTKAYKNVKNYLFEKGNEVSDDTIELSREAVKGNDYTSIPAIQKRREELETYIKERKARIEASIVPQSTKQRRYQEEIAPAEASLERIASYLDEFKGQTGYSPEQLKDEDSARRLSVYDSMNDTIAKIDPEDKDAVYKESKIRAARNLDEEDSAIFAIKEAEASNRKKAADIDDEIAKIETRIERNPDLAPYLKATIEQKKILQGRLLAKADENSNAFIEMRKKRPGGKEDFLKDPDDIVNEKSEAGEQRRTLMDKAFEKFGDDLTSEQKLALYYIMLDKQHGKDIEAGNVRSKTGTTATSQYKMLGNAIADVFTGVNNQAEFVERELKLLAPVVSLNMTPKMMETMMDKVIGSSSVLKAVDTGLKLASTIDDEDSKIKHVFGVNDGISGVVGNLLKGVPQGFGVDTPGNTTKQSKANQLRTLIDNEELEVTEKADKIVEEMSHMTTAEITANTTGMLVPLVIEMGVAKRINPVTAERLGKYFKTATKAIQNAKTATQRNKARSKIGNFANKWGEKSAKFGEDVIEQTVTFEITGEMFDAQDLNWDQGIYGAIGGNVLKGLFGQLPKVFGEKATKALMSQAGNRVVGGLAEFSEEMGEGLSDTAKEMFGQSMSGVIKTALIDSYNGDKKAWDAFLKVTGKNFTPDMEMFDTFVASMITGAGMGQNIDFVGRGDSEIKKGIKEARSEKKVEEEIKANSDVIEDAGSMKQQIDEFVNKEDASEIQKNTLAPFSKELEEAIANNDREAMVEVVARAEQAAKDTEGAQELLDKSQRKLDSEERQKLIAEKSEKIKERIREERAERKPEKKAAKKEAEVTAKDEADNQRREGQKEAAAKEAVDFQNEKRAREEEAELASRQPSEADDVVLDQQAKKEAPTEAKDVEVEKGEIEAERKLISAKEAPKAASEKEAKTTAGIIRRLTAKKKKKTPESRKKVEKARKKLDEQGYTFSNGKPRALSEQVQEDVKSLANDPDATESSAQNRIQKLKDQGLNNHASQLEDAWKLRQLEAREKALNTQTQPTADANAPTETTNQETTQETESTPTTGETDTKKTDAPKETGTDAVNVTPNISIKEQDGKLVRVNNEGEVVKEVNENSPLAKKYKAKKENQEKFDKFAQQEEATDSQEEYDALDGYTSDGDLLVSKDGNSRVKVSKKKNSQGEAVILQTQEKDDAGKWVNVDNFRYTNKKGNLLAVGDIPNLLKGEYDVNPSTVKPKAAPKKETPKKEVSKKKTPPKKETPVKEVEEELPPQEVLITKEEAEAAKEAEPEGDGVVAEGPLPPIKLSDKTQKAATYRVEVDNDNYVKIDDRWYAIDEDGNVTGNAIRKNTKRDKDFTANQRLIEGKTAPTKKTKKEKIKDNKKENSKQPLNSEPPTVKEKAPAKKKKRPTGPSEAETPAEKLTVSEIKEQLKTQDKVKIQTSQGVMTVKRAGKNTFDVLKTVTGFSKYAGATEAELADIITGGIKMSVENEARESTEEFVDAMNKLDTPFSVAKDFIKRLGVFVKTNIRSKFKGRDGVENVKFINIEDLARIPLVFNISDNLTSGNEGGIDNLQGGLFFNYTKGNENMAWAWTTKNKAKEAHERAVKLYEDNKPLFNKLWKDGKLPQGQIPMSIIKMGEDAVLSNEATFRVIAKNLKDVPAATKQKIFEYIKEQVNLPKKQRAAGPFKLSKPSTKEYVNSKSTLDEMIDDVANPETGLAISGRVPLVGMLTIGGLGLEAGKKVTVNKTTKAKTIPSLLLGAGVEPAAFHISKIVEEIAEPAIENVPIRHIISVVGVDVTVPFNPDLKSNHPNYPGALKGGPIGVLNDSVHVAAISKEVRNNILRFKIFDKKNDKFRDEAVTDGSAVSDGAPTQSALADAKFVGTKLEGESEISQVNSLLKFAFPNVSISNDKEAWNEIMQDETAQKFQSEGKTIYGATLDGKVYLNPDAATTNTSIHEFGHIWIDHTKNANPQLYARGLRLVQNTKEFEKAKELYGDTSKAREEALAILIGNRGETLVSAAKKSKFDNWVEALWRFVAKTFPNLQALTSKEIEKLTLDEFVNGVARDLLGGGEVSKDRPGVNNDTNFDKENKLILNEQLKKKPGARIFNKPNAKTGTIVEKYKKDKNIRVRGGRYITKLNQEKAKAIGEAYANMQNDPQNPEVKKAYDKMIDETLEQYQYFIDAGYTMELSNKEYSNSQDMIKDLRDNNRLRVFPTLEGFGETKPTASQIKNNPLLRETKYKDVNGVPLLANDIFRAVHDFFGHSERGNGFGAIGEENAWDVHARMYSPLARRAMTSETRGQNSWVNSSGVNDAAKAKFKEARALEKAGKLKEARKVKQEGLNLFQFAEQKIGLLPESMSQLEGDVSLSTESNAAKKRNDERRSLRDGIQKYADTFNTKGTKFLKLDARTGRGKLIKAFMQKFDDTNSVWQALQDMEARKGAPLNHADFPKGINRVKALVNKYNRLKELGNKLESAKNIKYSVGDSSVLGPKLESLSESISDIKKADVKVNEKIRKLIKQFLIENPDTTTTALYRGIKTRLSARGINEDRARVMINNLKNPNRVKEVKKVKDTLLKEATEPFSINNDSMDRLAEDLAIKIENPSDRHTFKEITQRALDRGTNTAPYVFNTLKNVLNGEQLYLAPEEYVGLQLFAENLKKRIDRRKKALESDPGSTQLNDDLMQMREMMEDIMTVSRITGTAASAALNIRRLFTSSPPSVDEVIISINNRRNNPLSKSKEKQIRDGFDTVENLEKEFEALVANTDEILSEMDKKVAEAILKKKKELGAKQKPSEKRIEELRKERAEIWSRMKKKMGFSSLGPLNALPELAQLVNNLIKSGVVNIANMITTLNSDPANDFTTLEAEDVLMALMSVDPDIASKFEVSVLGANLEIAKVDAAIRQQLIDFQKQLDSGITTYADLKLIETQLLGILGSEAEKAFSKELDAAEQAKSDALELQATKALDKIKTLATKMSPKEKAISQKVMDSQVKLESINAELRYLRSIKGLEEQITKAEAAGDFPLLNRLSTALEKELKRQAENGIVTMRNLQKKKLAVEKEIARLKAEGKAIPATTRKLDTAAVVELKGQIADVIAESRADSQLTELNTAIDRYTKEKDKEGWLAAIIGGKTPVLKQAEELLKSEIGQAVTRKTRDKLDAKRKELNRRRSQLRKLIQEIDTPGWLRTAKSFIDMSRTLKATADWSGTLRQGGFYWAMVSDKYSIKAGGMRIGIPGGPALVSFFKAMGLAGDALYTGGADAANAKLEELMAGGGDLAVHYGVELTKVNDLTLAEELFASDLADKMMNNKIPVPGISHVVAGFGRVVLASEVAMVTFLNMGRVELFNRFHAENRDVMTEDHGVAIANFINRVSGRGDLKVFANEDGGILEKQTRTQENIFGLAGSVFFAPRFAVSRFNTLTDVGRAALGTIIQDTTLADQGQKAANVVRRARGKEEKTGRRLDKFKTFKTRQRVLAVTLGDLGIRAARSAMWVALLKSLLPCEQASFNPTDKEFGKVKCGNIRIDLGGGYSQVLRLMGSNWDDIENDEKDKVDKNAAKDFTRFWGYKLHPFYQSYKPILLNRTIFGEKMGKTGESHTRGLITQIYNGIAGNGLGPQNEFENTFANRLLYTLADRHTPLSGVTLMELNRDARENPKNFHMPGLAVPALSLIEMSGEGINVHKKRKKKKGKKKKKVF